MLDSEDEAPKKKVKATPPRLGSKVKSHSAVAGKSKVISPTAVRGRSKVKSSLAVGVKKEVKSATDFFGSAPVKRSPYFKSSSDEKRKDEVCRTEHIFSTQSIILAHVYLES